MSTPNKNNNNDDMGTWIAAIVLLFLFPPVGIIMLLSKLASSAKQVNSQQKRASMNHYSATKRSSGSSATNSASTSSAPKQSASKYSNATTVKYTAAASPTGNATQNFHKERTTQSNKNSDDTSTLNSKLLKKERKSAKALSFWLTLFGIILGAAGLARVAGLGPDIFQLSAHVLTEIIWSGGYLVGGAALIGYGRGIVPRRGKLRQRYLSCIGVNKTMRVADLSSALGRSENKVRGDLQAMLDDGYFGTNAYFDAMRDALVLDSSFVTEPVQKQASKAADETPISEYDRILRELRTLDDKILDNSISSKIVRIEYISGKIFSIVQENPDKLPQIRRFMNYYLPTTLKLLRSYSTLERQGIDGENISAAKDNIDRVLGTLADGFEQQLDQLFRADAIDIDADIEVLENMMATDGLTDSSPFVQTSDGTIFPL